MLTIYLNRKKLVKSGFNQDILEKLLNNNTVYIIGIYNEDNDNVFDGYYAKGQFYKKNKNQDVYKTKYSLKTDINLIYLSSSKYIVNKNGDFKPSVNSFIKLYVDGIKRYENYIENWNFHEILDLTLVYLITFKPKEGPNLSINSYIYYNKEFYENGSFKLTDLPYFAGNIKIYANKQNLKYQEIDGKIDFIEIAEEKIQLI